MRDPSYCRLFSLRLACSGPAGAVALNAAIQADGATSRWIERREGVVRADAQGIDVGVPRSCIPACDESDREWAGVLDWSIRVPGAAQAGAYVGTAEPAGAVVLHNLNATPDGGADPAGSLGSMMRLHTDPTVGADNTYSAGVPWAATDTVFHPGVAPLRVLIQLPALLAHARAEGSIRAPTYLVRLGMRPLHWKYYFLDTARLEGAEVVDSQGSPVFSELRAAQLADGRSAWACLSKTVLDWTSPQAPELRLQRREAGRVRVLIPRLPVARPDRLGYETIGGDRLLVSEIYV